MSRPRQFKRWLSTASAMRKAAYVAVFGIFVLLLGMGLTYQRLLEPPLAAIERIGAGVLKFFVGDAGIPVAKHFVGGAFLLLGGYVIYIGGKLAIREVMRILNPDQKGKIFGTFMRKQVLMSGPSVVVIGGGTGLSTLLRGLKARTSRITAIVTVTDDGGSSGRLRKDKNILPPGDIRNCLVALADTEKAMTDLFQHRFEGASGSLSGHSTGNLLIAAMVDITGDFDQAVRQVSNILAIRGRVMPVTLERVRLRAEMEDGSEVCGETNIVNSRLRIRKMFLDPADSAPLPDVLTAIEEADLIVLGPGSIYTSVIPPLLVPGIAQAVSNSSATKAYVCNVMTQPGESDGLTASDHVRAIEANVGVRVFDFVLVNKATPSKYILDKYAEVGQEFVIGDTDRIRAMGLRPVAANLISESEVVRHDPMRVAESLMRLVE